jgi:hypothetical protein
MTEIELNGHKYRIGKLPAKAQFHIARRLLPLLSSLSDLTGGEAKALEAIGRAIGALSDAEADYVLFGLLRAVSRRIEGGGWSAVVAGEASLAYDDINMMTMLKLAGEVFRENLGDFLGGLPPALAGQQ